MKRNMKKALSVMLSAVLVSTSISVGSNVKTVNAADTITVNTYDDLLALGNNIKSLGDEVVVNVESDIIVTDRKWSAIPINNKKSVVINGNGKTIKGLNNEEVENPGSNVALFNVQNTSKLTINKLNIDDAKLAGNHHVAALIGSYNVVNNNDSKLTINSCTVKNATLSGNNHVGSFIGGAYQVEEKSSGPSVKCANVVINDCAAEKNDINAPSDYGKKNANLIGGLVGYMYAGSITGSTSDVTINVGTDAYSCYGFGGIVGGSIYPQSGFGNPSAIIISKCTNKGSITTDKQVIGIGGIVGIGYFEIDNCTNEGDINAKYSNYSAGIAGVTYANIKNSTNKGTVAGSNYVGGICGRNNKTIYNCTNVGNVIGCVGSDGKNVAYDVGGIVGYNGEGGIVKKVTNTGNVDGYVDVGGDIGRNSGTAQDCKNTGDVTASAYVGGNIGIDENFAKVLENKGKVTGEYYVGGNIGSERGSTGDDKTENLKNSGEVDGKTTVGGNIGYVNKESEVSILKNTGDVSGENNIGGNVGVNKGKITDLVNDGNADGGSYIGGNVGINEESGNIDNALNNGDVTGADYVGGNIGVNNGVAKNMGNNGDIVGNENVGGNIGENNKKTENNRNSGDVTGDENIGGNIGHNNTEASSDNAQNLGDVSGEESVGANIGLDEGKSSNNNNLSGAERNKDDEKGFEIVTVKEESTKYGNIKYGVDPKGAGAIYLKEVSNQIIKLTAIPIEGYKFKEWKLKGISQKSGEITDYSIEINKSVYGGEVYARFEKAKAGDTIITPDRKSDKEEKTFEYADGLVLAIKPARGGRIDFVSASKGSIALTAVAQAGYKFDKWVTSGNAKVYSGLQATSATCTFNYTPDTDAKITAVFKTNIADGPKAGSKVKDKKYFYKVTKAGSKDGSIYGDVTVTGLRKKTLTTLKIAAKVKIGGVNYNVTSIGAKAFKGNKVATKVYIGKKVKNIGKNAFAGMSKLKSVSIVSKKLTKIGASAFAGDKKLSKVVIKSSKLKKVGKKAFYRKGGKKLTIVVPKAKKKAYAKIFKKAKTNKFKIK